MSEYLDLPRRSLAEARMDLMLDRLRWLSRQLAAEIAGNAPAAASCGEIIEALTATLRSLDAEIAERQPG
jgi:hypothetical protein